MTQERTQKWLIMPLEVVERELEAKLLICREAIKRGWGCIIGNNRELHRSLDDMPQGLVFIKSIQAHELPYLKDLKKRGHAIACLDEEGLVQNNLEHMLSVRSTKETIKEIDAFLFWGDVQYKAHLERHPEFQDKFFATSNPRIDLWSRKKYHTLYQDEVDKIHAQYGEYFIIPTSFGTYNHKMGKEGAMNVYKSGKLVDDEYYEFLEGYQNYAKNIYYGFIDLIAPLSAKFPDTTIIIRPHPSENRDPWDELAQQFDNVHVVFSGNVTPWLLGAKAVVHCGSTTAVEAHLLGRPVISYCRGYSDPQYALEVPAKVSINVTEENEVLDLLESINQGIDIKKNHPEVNAGHEWLKGWAASIDSDDTSSKVMNVLDRIPCPEQTYTLSPIKDKMRLDIHGLKALAWSILRIINHIPLINKLLPFKVKFGIQVYHYTRKKTNEMHNEDIENFLYQLRNTDNSVDIDIIPLKKSVTALCAKQ